MAIEQNTATAHLALIDPPEAKNPFDVVPVYANNIGLSGTLADMQITFTEIRQGTSAGGSLQPENIVKAMIQVPLSQVTSLITAIQQFKSQSDANLKSLRDELQKQNAARS